jgi:hypothetical protein
MLLRPLRCLFRLLRCSPVNVLANSNTSTDSLHPPSAPTGDEEQQVVEDKYVGLPSSEEARLEKAAARHDKTVVLVYLLQDNNVGLAGRYNGNRAMQLLPRPMVER